ncbi:MAG TPA: response regulator [Trichocoleus sp.]
MLPEDQKRILGYFIEEAKDHLNTIEQGLLNLQATIEDSEMINEVFRAAHSVKGGAAMLGLESIQHTSHRLEDYFKVLKEAPVQADRTLESMLLQVFDGLQEQLEQLQGPFGLTEDKAREIMTAIEPVFDQVHQHLESLVQKAGVAPSRQPAARPRVSMPVAAAEPTAAPHAEASALQLVFKSDVPAHLRTMLGLFKQPDTAATRQEIQGICQQLLRIGEQFELPAWCALVDAAQRVVGNDQQTFRTLAPLLIKEIKAGQDLVLANQANRVTVSLAMQDLLPLEVTDPVLAEESLDALLEEALSDTSEEADLIDLFATAEAEQPFGEIALTSSDAWFDEVNQPGIATDADINLAAVFDGLDSNGNQSLNVVEDAAGPVIGTGPEVGAAELNSLADLFEGEVSELDGVWEEEEIAEVSLDEAEEAISELNIEREFDDLLLDETDSLTAASVNAIESGSDDEFASLFGNTLLEESDEPLSFDETEPEAGSADMLSSIGLSNSSEEAEPTALTANAAAKDTSDFSVEDNVLGDLWDSSASEEDSFESSFDVISASESSGALDDFFATPEAPLSAEQPEPGDELDDFFAESSQSESSIRNETAAAEFLVESPDGSSSSADDLDVAADLWGEETSASDLYVDPFPVSLTDAAGLEEILLEQVLTEETSTDDIDSLDLDVLTTSPSAEAGEFDTGFDLDELDLAFPESSSEDTDSLSGLGWDSSVSSEVTYEAPDEALSDTLGLLDFAEASEADFAAATPEFDFSGLDLDDLGAADTSPELGEAQNFGEPINSAAEAEEFDLGDLDLAFADELSAEEAGSGSSDQISDFDLIFAPDASAGETAEETDSFDLGLSKEAGIDSGNETSDFGLIFASDASAEEPTEETDNFDLDLLEEAGSGSSDEASDFDLIFASGASAGETAEETDGFDLDFSEEAGLDSSDEASDFGLIFALDASAEETAEETDSFDLDLSLASGEGTELLGDGFNEEAIDLDFAAVDEPQASLSNADFEDFEFELTGSEVSVESDTEEAADLAVEPDFGLDLAALDAGFLPVDAIESAESTALETPDFALAFDDDLDLGLDEATAAGWSDLEGQSDLELTSDLTINSMSDPSPDIDEDFGLISSLDENSSETDTFSALDSSVSDVGLLGTNLIDSDSRSSTTPPGASETADQSFWSDDLSDDLWTASEEQSLASSAAADVDFDSVDAFFDISQVDTSESAAASTTGAADSLSDSSSELEEPFATSEMAESLLDDELYSDSWGIPEAEDVPAENVSAEDVPNEEAFDFAGVSPEADWTAALDSELANDLNLLGESSTEGEPTASDSEVFPPESLVDFADLEASLDTADFADDEPVTEVSDNLDGDLGFDELDSLLNDDELAVEPANFQEAGSFENAAETGGSDDFADLDALLEEEIGTSTAPGFAAIENAGSTLEPSLDIEDEFGDLEKLLEEADQLGGSAPALGIRRAQAASARRNPRRAGVLADQTMRVSVKHLDNLSNLVGELVVNRNSLEQDQERLRQFLDNLLFQVQQLNDVGQRMRDLYERSLLESSLISSRQAFQTAGVSDAGSSHATGVTFDALEMDRFTGFHTLSQEMIELIVRVRESSSDIAFTIESTDQITRQFRQVTTQLQEGLNKARMVPFAQTADRLPRAVRDISLKCGKEAKLVVEGRDTLIDKMILERLYDPMTHLVNNAITHGVETPEERMAAGKSREGTITVRAFYQGNQTVIYIADDGAGISPDIVKEKAVKRGLITPAEARTMTKLDVYELLFLPGFSTRDQADDFAGRGVGMDVVRTALSEIRGSVTIDSEMGKGTSFTIRLPLTLSISKALSCVNNQARIAFPMDGVEDMFDAPRERVQVNDQGQSCILWRDTLLPFRPLAELLQFNRTLGRGRVYGGNQDDDIVSIVVLRSANTFIALEVDQVIGEQEIVIKQLEGPVPKPTGIAGATVLGDGRVMPIADVLELIDLSMGRVRRDPAASLWSQTEEGLPPVAEAPAQADPTVLIVDDSITVRELLSMSFNKVGYRVEQARDGQEAWEKLRSGLPCDLVFCDIEMPRMDGLELLSRMQKDSALSQVPIAMLTSRGADRHRQMAVDLGAKGYFTKPYLEEVLLDAAQRMLNGENMVGHRGT